MELQVALDRMPLDRAVDLAALVAPYVDLVEVGTSLVKAHGMRAVTAVAEAAGDRRVLADLKTADDAVTEFRMAFRAGAAAATVLGCVDDASIHAAVEEARRHGGEAVVDLMATTPARRAALAAALPDEVVLAAHVPRDARHRTGSPLDLLGHWASGRRVAVAGGITVDDVPLLTGRPDLRVIVGSAVTASDDPAGACCRLREATAAVAG